MSANTGALSIRTRAALAVALLVGFYVLALAMAGGLLFIPYAEIRYADRIEGRLALFCIVGAFLILKSIVPRRDRFDPPGPRLTAAAQPELFALIDDVAARTGQAPPADVYLAADVNAFVAERGGFMGVGSRRVMGLGLPLLEALTVAELRAVVAHEFGHYVGGDTRLGPWVYRTRAAIERTLMNLSRHSSLLSKPFRWYGLGFLRVTHAVSRQQEYVADAVAARTAGTASAASALRRISGAAAAYGSFWSSELAPALERGYRPPLADGFRRFLGAPTVAPHVDAAIDSELREGKSDPYDTHPCLRDRLAALDRVVRTGDDPHPPGDDTRRATELLGASVDALEAELIAMLARKDLPPLVAVSWDEAPAAVLPAGWREAVSRHLAALDGLTPEALPPLARSAAGALEMRLALAPDREHVTEEVASRAAALVGCALALAMRDAGRGRLHAPPGEPVSFVVGGETVLPFSLLARLADGSLDDAAWAALCATTGIAGLDLGGVARRASAAPAR
ncbi:MAG TPA: M48 family metallopeptidase [Gemmatimonadaceae bacterium]|nr:M48 family metallopeptidase [Gemmatimonadaceae bacterium]